MRSNSNELLDDEAKPEPESSLIKGLVSHLAPPQIDSQNKSKMNRLLPGLNDSLWSDNSEDEADKLGGV